MAIIHNAIVVIISISLLAQTHSIIASTDPEPHILSNFNRSSFPKDFIFGTASSSYQYKGAANDDGRGPSIWDTFTYNFSDSSIGDEAIDFYQRYKEDVQIMKDMNLDAFRFSISWSRLLPRGKLNGAVSREGIDFYNNLINELLSNGLQPYVTIFYWDLPQPLEEECSGFLSPHIVKSMNDFRDFAELCFQEFGDREKYGTSINEPWTYSSRGYDEGIFAPGRCSTWGNEACQAGDSSIEPYLVSHNMLLCQTAAVDVYPIKISSYRFMDPLTYGDYPISMRVLLGERLPKFTQEQLIMVNGGFDFLGLNYYSSYHAVNVPVPNSVDIRYSTDSLSHLTTDRDGLPIGVQAASSRLHIYPKGLRDLLIYVKGYYKNPIIYITKNGVDEFSNSTLPLEESLKDTVRIEYYRRHLWFLHKAIQEGVNVKGYFVWSFLDNFEWSDGYTVRFGIYFIDYEDGLK